MKRIFFSLLVLFLGTLPVSAKQEYVMSAAGYLEPVMVRSHSHVRHSHKRVVHHYHYRRHRAVVHQQPEKVDSIREALDVPGHVLIERAMQYLGGNPTGWSHVWCGKFMAMIDPNAAKKVGNPYYALDWADLPHTTPRVGAIAVIRRRGGGHVGVVMRFDRQGNPIIISGNHGHRVGIGTYPKEYVVAYVQG